MDPVILTVFDLVGANPTNRNGDTIQTLGKMPSNSFAFPVFIGAEEDFIGIFGGNSGEQRHYLQERKRESVSQMHARYLFGSGTI